MWYQGRSETDSESSMGLSDGMEVNRHALRAIRERSGMSLSQLARAADVSQPHLSNVEAGRRRPSPELTLRLADVLRVPVVALLAAPGPTGAEGVEAAGP